jgi:hypothetical protein
MYYWPVHLLSEDVSSREDASTSWPSSSGLRCHKRTYLTILESADDDLFKMVGYVLLHSGMSSSKQPDMNFFANFFRTKY